MAPLATPPPLSAPLGIDLHWTREHVPLGLYFDERGEEHEVVGYALQATSGQRRRPFVLYRSVRYPWTNARETQDFLAFLPTTDGGWRPRFLFVGPPPSWWTRFRLRFSQWRGSSRY